MENVDRLLERLENVQRKGDRWEAFCPYHGDTKTRHLSITLGDEGKIVMHCHHGCDNVSILQAIDLRFSDLFPRGTVRGSRTEYRLRNSRNEPVAKHVRTVGKNGEKEMRWEGGLKGRPRDTLPLYGSEAMASVPLGCTVVLTEGQKAAEALTQHDIPALGTVTGATGLPDEGSLSVLKGYTVALWPDNDRLGKKHMQRIGKKLLEMECEVRWFEWADAPEKGDAADYPDLNGIYADIKAAPKFKLPRDRQGEGAVSLAYATETYRKMRELRKKTGGISGIRTGITKIDRMIFGLNRGYSYIVAARPNVGKSLFVAQVALTAARNGNRVLMQVPEMSDDQYVARWACYMAGVEYRKDQEGRTRTDEDEAIDFNLDLLEQLPLRIDDWGTQTIDRVRGNIESVQPDLVIVDYLQKMAPDDPRASRNQQVGQISRDLASLKSEYDIPVVIAAQLNRGLEYRTNAEPMLADLRDSGEIEQDADVVMFLHRPEMHTEDDREVRLFCRKSRMGQLFNTTMFFVPGQNWLTDQQSFTDIGRVS